MTVEVDNFLEHFGVKGMKWGRRSSGNSVDVARKPSEKEVAKAEYKSKVSYARKDLYKGVKETYVGSTQNKVISGSAIAASLLLGGTSGTLSVGTIVVGTQMMRSAGYSKGKSVAMGLIGGAPGAALAIELKARRMAKG